MEKEPLTSKLDNKTIKQNYLLSENHKLKYIISFRMLRRVAQRVSQTSLRRLNLQEYSSKQLMEEHGLAVQRFRMAETEAEGVEGGKL